MTVEKKEGEAFLDRWSRRKREQGEEESVAPPAPGQAAPPAPLPPVADLKPDSDFKPFMQPKVDGETRRAALKKLFTDAHFNVPDPFEPYSVDLTVSESIPEEMLKTLEHAKRMFLDPPEAQAAGAQAAVAQAPAAAPAKETEPKDAPGKQDA